MWILGIKGLMAQRTIFVGRFGQPLRTRRFAVFQSQNVDTAVCGCIW